MKDNFNNPVVVEIKKGNFILLADDNSEDEFNLSENLGCYFRTPRHGFRVEKDGQVFEAETLEPVDAICAKGNFVWIYESTKTNPWIVGINLEMIASPEKNEER